MDSKRLGIIGGMGPKATAVFMDKIIENTVAECDQDHIDMIILNHATLPDRTTVILEESHDLFLHAISRDVKLLELAKAANIAIPCNTSHYYYDPIQAMTEIPIIHMVDETLREIRDRFGENSKVGVLATNGTVRSGVYRMGCDKFNLQLHMPTEAVQEQVMQVIYNVKSDIPIQPQHLEAIIHDLIGKGQCQCVILACTELSCIPLSPETAAYCVDAMDVLVKKSIELSGKRMKRRV